MIVDTRVDAAAAARPGIQTRRASSAPTTTRAAGSRGEYLRRRSAAARPRSALLEGIPGHETGDSRLRGFQDAIKDAPGIKIVASQTANWERDQGFTVFQNMLQAHPEIDALFACNDMMALGAIEAIAAAGKTGQDPGDRLRRGGRRAQGDRGGDDARLGRAVPRGDGPAGGRERRQAHPGQKPVPEQQVRIELVTKATLSGEPK